MYESLPVLTDRADFEAELETRIIVQRHLYEEKLEENTRLHQQKIALSFLKQLDENTVLDAIAMAKARGERQRVTLVNELVRDEDDAFATRERILDTPLCYLLESDRREQSIRVLLRCMLTEDYLVVSRLTGGPGFYYVIEVVWDPVAVALPSLYACCTCCWCW